jgi:flagellar biosynthesis protein FlhB
MLRDNSLFQESENQEDTKDEFIEQFVSDFIHSQKAKIESRKLIEEFLFFTACQVASASLALVLFQFAVTQLFTTWLCLFVAWIPSISSLTEVNFHKTEDGWSLQIMKRPITTLIKFTSSVGIVTFTIYSIANDIQATTQQINAVYAEIQAYEQPKIEQFMPPFFWQVILASVGIVLLFGFVKSMKDRNPF